jgi:nucleoside-diphosphate-sugar epimerase
MPKQSNHKTVFVTGAAGFVGANLVRRLIKEKYKVFGLVRKQSDLWRLKGLGKNIKLVKGDLRNKKIVDRIISRAKPDIIYHLSAHGGYSWQDDFTTIFETNVTGTYNLLNACLKANVRMFVNTGTSSEYGFKTKPMKETDTAEPNSSYAISKAAQTTLCAHFSKANNFPLATLRLFSVYGPFEEPKRFIPTLVRSCFKNQTLNLVNPKTARDFIYIDDVADVLLEMSRHTELRGEIFNLGTGEQSTIKDAVNVVLKNIKTKSRAEWNTMPNRKWDSDKWVADSGKLQRFLKWRPKNDLETGLKKTIMWFKMNSRLYTKHNS